ncbi:MAG: NAD-dependent succinate-semialdehyde dehydrogenase [Candidatus Omnitrophica bacterium]|nr:NAD-dependent succinate-semialdehyde dehydrogenase [Candidatus Omnitrophota bacterium]
MSLTSVNPATGLVLKSYLEMTPDEAAGVVEAVQAGFIGWRDTPFSLRQEVLIQAASSLRLRRADFAALMVLEMGKPIREAEAEIDKCAWACEYFAGQAEEGLRDEWVATETRKSYIRYEPLGVILAIMPWNFPFWQFFRFAAPALMAGNTVLLKHAPNVTGCALAIESIFQGMDGPKGLVRALLVSEDLTDSLMKHPGIRGVTLTGSTRSGRVVASRAGEALKKTVLELGGSDPCLILEDADLERAAESCVASRLINNGQSCIAAKRFIAHEGVARIFEELVVRKMAAQTMGDPMDRGVTLGPLARQDLRDHLDGQVKESVALGAQVVLGAQLPKGPGFYYPPTVLKNISPGMPAYREEFFGPVAALFTAETEDEMVRLANDTPFGLGAAVFTRDVERGEKLALRLEAGCVFVNTFVKSDPRLPFGGVKASGYGRELSRFGIREFVNVKTVVVA